eukprot:NODE_29_length_37665_cov_1.081563.p14 type:complete len:329 gc:universal NODE_29_length_37665_cov_1.081563:8320-7334(-)
MIDKTRYLIKVLEHIQLNRKTVLHIFRPPQFYLDSAIQSLSAWNNSFDNRNFLFQGSEALKKANSQSIIQPRIKIIHGSQLLDFKPLKNGETIIINDLNYFIVEHILRNRNIEDKVVKVIEKLNLIYEKSNCLILTSSSLIEVIKVIKGLDLPILDLTFNRNWGGVCGYTMNELETQVLPQLKSNSFFQSMDSKYILDLLRQNVSGYIFGDEIISHPFLTRLLIENPTHFFSCIPPMLNSEQVFYAKKMINKNEIKNIWLSLHEDSLSIPPEELCDLRLSQMDRKRAIKVLFELGILSYANKDNYQLDFPNLTARRYFNQFLLGNLDK